MFIFLQKLRVLLTPQDKWKLVRVILLLTVSAILEIAGIGLLMPVIAVFFKPQLLESNRFLSFFYHLIPGGGTHSFLYLSCGAVAVLYLLKNAFSLWVTHVQSVFIFRKQGELSARLYRTYVEAPYSLALQISPAEFNIRISRVTAVCSCILLPVMLILADAFVAIVLIGVLLFAVPAVTLGSAAFMLLAGLAVYLPLKKLNTFWGKQQMKYESLVSALRLDGFNGLKDVKSAGCEEFFAGRYRDAESVKVQYDAKMYTLGQLPRLALESFAILLALGVFLILVLAGFSSDYILMTFSLLLAVMSRLLPSFSRIHYNLTRVRQYFSVFEQFFQDITGIPGEICVRPGAPELTLKENIRIENLCFRYGEKKIFEDFSLTIPARSSVALVGPTGCGKTTLVDLILGLHKAQSGRILADGVDIAENLISWRKKIAYVPQYIYLLDGTVRENVAFGIPEEERNEEKIIASLKVAQVWDVVCNLPQKLDTPIGADGVLLSGGQRQRLGIARALYRAPELLILDEATSALDNETEKAFVDTLETLRGKLTVITIAHRLSTVEKCDLRVELGR